MRTRQPTKRTDGPSVDRAFECDYCGRRWYYTRCLCPNCGREEISTYALEEGTLIAVTKVAVTPPDVRSPNWLGVARFGEVQVIGQLEGEGAVGDRVAFSGEHHLRSGDDETNPRLTVVE